MLAPRCLAAQEADRFRCASPAGRKPWNAFSPDRCNADHRIFHADERGGVTRRLKGLGDNQRDRLAGEQNPFRMQRPERVAGRSRLVAPAVIQPRCLAVILVGKDLDDTGHRAGPTSIE